MHPELQEALVAYRQSRNFDPQTYLEAKSALLSVYFSQAGIKACVVGLSDDVDSAVVIGILAHISRLPGSSLKRIIPLLLPAHTKNVTTHKDAATGYSVEVCQALRIPPVEVNWKSRIQAPWELFNGTRTSMLSYHRNLATKEGLLCVLCGSTNRDVGSYVGLFDKEIDGMVDLQLLSDLHKSEVYKLAALLRIPEGIVEATPERELRAYDGLSEEDTFGISFDFLELHEWWLCENGKKSWLRTLSKEALNEFKTVAEKLESLHQKNKYKHAGVSAAVHLNVFPRVFPGGLEGQDSAAPPTISWSALSKARIGSVELPDDLFKDEDSSTTTEISTEPILDYGNSAVLVSQALPANTCSKLLSESRQWNWVEADEHGRPIQNDHEASRVTGGSCRAMAYDESFASRLWQRLSPSLPQFRTMSELTPTDCGGYPVWKPVGIHPMLRFIRYEERGNMVPHYDTGFDFKDGRHRTLMSVIISLTNSSNGGTRFLLDRQRSIPFGDRKFNNFDRIARDEEVLYLVPGRKGDALIFDHGILHDAAVFRGTNSQVVLRTDIVFERCASNAISWINPSEETAEDKESLLEKWIHNSTCSEANSVLRDEMKGPGYYDYHLDEFISFLPEVRTAPLQHLFHKLSKTSASAPLAVLVTTGGMCPLHTGHMNMMHEAKAVVESTGKTVLAGLIVPDHDSYTLLKCGKTALNIGQRLHLAEEAVSGSDWLSIDHWAGYYPPSLVEFTTIAKRVRVQLAAQVPIARPIEIIYVCGGDNAWFVLSFAEKGSCVVVSRPGSDGKVNSVKRHPKVVNNRRIMFTGITTSTAASSNIRKGDFQHLPPSVIAKYQKIRDGQRMPLRLTDSNQEVNFYISHECDWAVSHWVERFSLDASVLSRAYESFCKGLTTVFQSAFDKERKANGGPKVHIKPSYLADQRKTFQQLKDSRYSDKVMISLDPCIPSDHNIAISRCFELVGVSDDCEFVATPGHESLESQVDQLFNKIRNGDADQGIILFDDYSFTGRTFAMVRSLLESRHPKCKVIAHTTLRDFDSQPNPDTSNNPPQLNQINCRDFLAGSREGGLVVRVPRGGVHGPSQEVYRVPYVLPFVRPTYKASIPMDQELEFSRQVRELNLQFMADTGLSKEDIKSDLAGLLHDWIDETIKLL